ncbi:MAG: hypothetical protein GY943_20060, partial [Chloroflexi bacterium]|nr:hypothetical protein [Chloroflexota bacterium]
TAYEPTEHIVQKVGFATNAYFDLVTAVPELGQYLALGDRVLFVYGNQAYEIVEDAGDTVVIIPEAEPTVRPLDPIIETATPYVIVDTTPPDGNTPDNMIASSPRPDTSDSDTNLILWVVIILTAAVVGYGIWMIKETAEEEQQ